MPACARPHGPIPKPIGLWATEDSGLEWVVLPYFIFGLGFGFIADPVSVTALSSLPREKAGLASSIISTSKQVGQMLGIAGAGTLLAVAGTDETHEFEMMGGWVWIMLAACGAGIVLLNLARTQTRPAGVPEAVA